MVERQQWQSDRAMRVRGTEPGPESEVSVLDGLLTRIVSCNDPWGSLPTKRGPGRSAEVSRLQGEGGCQYLGPEVNQGYSALTNFVRFLGKDTILLSSKATCFSSPTYSPFWASGLLVPKVLGCVVAVLGMCL